MYPKIHPNRYSRCAVTSICNIARASLTINAIKPKERWRRVGILTRHSSKILLQMNHQRVLARHAINRARLTVSPSSRHSKTNRNALTTSRSSWKCSNTWLVDWWKFVTFCLTRVWYIFCDCLSSMDTSAVSLGAIPFGEFFHKLMIADRYVDAVLMAILLLFYN
jgi:hypothetical protein